MKKVRKVRVDPGQFLTMGDISTLVGVPIRAIQYWLLRGLIVPAKVIPGPTGRRTRHLFSFQGLLQARIIYDLIAGGLSVLTVEKIQKNLKKIGYSERLKDGFLLISDGGVEVVGRDWLGRDKYFDLVSGQMLLFSTKGTYEVVKKALESEELQEIEVT